jgi:RNA-directed DNA polymerase
MEVKLKDLEDIFDNEIRKGVKNKQRILNFEKYKMEYLIDIKKVLDNNTYDGGRYNIFLIYKPKLRVVMSQNIYDKIINHYVAKYILIPKLSKYLRKENCATRKNMGTSYAIKLFKQYIEDNKKYTNIYFLKIDISKFFYSLDHEVIKKLIINDLNEDEYKIICTILDSTNKDYVNIRISNLEKKINQELPRYTYGKGLPIGNQTSQFLAILYLAKLQHYIKCNLHLKYFINYMDDYVIIHHDKEYLKECLDVIKDKLDIEYLLKVNPKKTYIINAREGINFLGYTFKVINKKTIIKLPKETKVRIRKGIKRSKYLYMNNKITLKQLFCSIQTYKYSYIFVSHKKVMETFAKYWY